ncbi:hypothetical protein FB451DRAFT_1267739 [Mycena latifolia]|nr:hypothetical protein FB451DRAFT_1267739 [Mycena latifolia]
MPTAELQTRDAHRDGAVRQSLDERSLDETSAKIQKSLGRTQPAACNRLTKFEGDMRNLTDCLAVLRQTPNLVECAFMLMVREAHVDASATYAPVIHRELRNLRLVVHKKSLCVVPLLLPRLTLPALHTFQLDQYHESLVAFLGRHSVHLRDLSMEYPPVDALHPLPALTRLTMYPSSKRNLAFTRTFFARLEAPDTDFLPALQHLRLPVFESREPADFVLMGHALAARWTHHHHNHDVAEIRSLSLMFGLFDKEVIDNFQGVLSPLTELHARGAGTNIEIGTHLLRPDYEYDYGSDSDDSGDSGSDLDDSGSDSDDPGSDSDDFGSDSDDSGSDSEAPSSCDDS